MRTKEKPRKTLDEEEKTRRRRRNLIRVFTFTRWCFIYKHVLLGPRATAQPIKIFYNSSYILRTADDNINEEKQEKETMVA
jgi:hypothetical protein